MNKGKAKRLRRELEREQSKIDRGHGFALKRIAEERRRKDLALLRPEPVPLTGVQLAVHAPDARPNDALSFS